MAVKGRRGEEGPLLTLVYLASPFPTFKSLPMLLIGHQCNCTVRRMFSVVFLCGGGGGGGGEGVEYETGDCADPEKLLNP